MPTRRDALRAGSLGTAAIGLSASAQLASATHPRQQPDHVSIAFEESTLNTYRPLLDISQSSREKLIGLYGWVARSPEHDTAVCVYWCSYTHQEAPAWAPETGHIGDHEPIAVEFDPDTGEVLRVRASIYHWIKGEVAGSDAVLDDRNPTLRVIDPYHHYTAQPDASLCSEFPVEDLTAVFEAWLDNGLEEDLHVGACYNPWVMHTQSDWWAPGEFGLPGGFSIEVPNGDALRARAAKAADFGIIGSLTA